MKKLDIAIGFCFALLIMASCTGEDRRVHAKFVKESTKSAAQNVPEPMKPGMAVVAESAEQVSRDLGEPKVPLTPVDFSKDTHGQAAVAAAQIEVDSYKKKLEAKEQLIASIKSWGTGGLIALLGLFGINAGWIFKLIGTARSLKAAYDSKSKQVVSLVEGTQEIIHQATYMVPVIKAEIEKVKKGQAPDMSKIIPLGADAIKAIHEATQLAAGTKDTLKEVVDTVKEQWKSGKLAFLDEKAA